MTSTVTLSELAQQLHALHRPGEPGVLPTVWDAWSAQVAAEAGFRGLTVGSHPVADSLGRPDGEGMTFQELMSRVAQITDAVELPVSVDVESGYGLPPHEVVEGLLAVGAVGLNVEDTVHSEGGRLRSAEEHAAYVAGLRAACEVAHVDMVVNARTDWFKGEHGDPATRVEDAVARMLLCAEAGASCLYPVGFHDEATLTRLCRDLPAPVNAIARPDVDDLAMYQRAGAARISFGPTWQMALARVSQEWLARWR